MGCCSGNDSQADTAVASADHNSAEQDSACCPPKQRFDYLLWGGVGIVSVFYALNLILSPATLGEVSSALDASHVHPSNSHTAESLTSPVMAYLQAMAEAVFSLFNTMFWGMVIGVIMVACLARVPRAFVLAVLGDKPGVNGMLRATLAGLMLDLCSHGILMVGAKLYERGASIGQVMAFLIASPWNSLSLTVILITLIGWSWTLVFILLSALVAIVTGLIFDAFVKRGTLPENPHRHIVDKDFRFWREAKQGLAGLRFSLAGSWRFITQGAKESTMVIRWLMVGIILASLIRTFVPEGYFGTYFGPTFLGLMVTLVVATVLEVCSEGSTPIAADIFNRAGAPGNSFAFLMTGVATDYTEIMVLKERTRSWRIALFLPLITVPQVIVIALVLNQL